MDAKKRLREHTSQQKGSDAWVREVGCGRAVIGNQEMTEQLGKRIEEEDKEVEKT